MGAQGDKASDGMKVAMEPCQPRADNQRWTITTGEGAGGAAIVGLDGFCLDVRGSSGAAGAPVQLYSCHFKFNQRFIVGKDGTIKEQTSGKCLQGESDKPGALIVLAACKGAPSEKWHVQQ
jgi:Ricin-type beta-trefoil lectin domain